MLDNVRIHLVLFIFEALLGVTMIAADLQAARLGNTSLWDAYLFALLIQTALASGGVVFFARRDALSGWRIVVIHLLCLAPAFLAGLAFALFIDPFGRY